MQQVFRFWGYGPDVWEDLVGAGRLLEPAAAGARPPLLGRIRLDPSLAARLGELEQDLGEPVGYVVPADGDAGADGRELATLEPLDGGAPIPLIRETAGGGFRFLFDVDASIRFVEQERYFETRAPFYVKLGMSPDRLPAAVRKLILLGFHASRSLTRRKDDRRPAFPAAPKDLSVDLWRFLVGRLVAERGAAPLAPLWPEGKRYAVVLDHDVDTTWGLDSPGGIAAFRALEERHGMRSAWMTITGLHEAAADCLHELMAAGHEIGCHSTVHDHSIAYLPLERVRGRIAEARPFLEEFEVTGFRSPSYHRSETLFRGLDGALEYDMSMHDSFENANSPVPSFEGCSTCFPFRLEGTRLLELPTTVPEDFVLELQGRAPDEAARIQIDQLRTVARRRGLANLLTHPEPQLSAREGWRACYEQVLEYLAADEQAWIVLPREVCAWWNRRRDAIDAAWDAPASN